GGVVSVRGSPSRRIFWRDLHAVTGAFAGAVILFLAVTGMPWSMFWGAHVQKWATAANLYEPPPPAQVTPDWQMSATMPNMPHTPHGTDPAVSAQMPWAMEKMDMPTSQDMPGMSPIGVDRAAAIFRTLGLPAWASISLPDGPKGAYVASLRPDRVEDTRVVYLDQYTGKVLGDVGFKDWGPAAKAIEWGIAVHQGQEYGPLNRYLMLAGCVAVLLLAVTSITMWGKRRPKGALGVPPPPAEPRAARGLIAIMVVVGIIYPLVGATLIGAFLVDRGFVLAQRGLHPARKIA
ncbi:MAG TPA: PepSY domain-containing protein, partial [Caulobacteraceae bacterium]|nr:PepSY domain-containing protein [Caulobacteraceae bacterium]